MAFIIIGTALAQILVGTKTLLNVVQLNIVSIDKGILIPHIRLEFKIYRNLIRVNIENC